MASIVVHGEAQYSPEYIEIKSYLSQYFLPLPLFSSCLDAPPLHPPPDVSRVVCSYIAKP